MSVSCSRRAAIVLTLSVIVASAARGGAGEPTTVAELPTVTAGATDATAAEINPSDSGTVEIRRTGDVSAALDVNYTTFYSTADRGIDYRHPAEGTPGGWTAQTHTATIPAGAASITLPIVTKNDGVAEISETVEVLLSHKAQSYVIGAPESATVSIIDDESPRAPAAPTDLLATRVSDSQVNLGWSDKSTNEGGFTIEQRIDGSADFTVVADVPLRTTVYSVTSLPAGTGATYRVSAFNDIGRSASSNQASAAAAAPTTPSWLQHVRVAGEAGRTKGWPTNNGMWNWGDEIVVMYDDTEFRPSSFTHAFAFHKPVLAEQARSVDGGLSWTIEKDPIVKPGAPGFPADGNYGPDITDLPGPIDFQDPNFAMQVRMSNKDYGPSYFYYSYDRARTWRGPYRLPNFGYATVNARNDYIVDGNREMLLLLSGTPVTNDEGRSRPFAVRTTDGGMTWTFLSNVDAEGTIQPSTVRVSPTELVTAVRTRTGINVSGSQDNGRSWTPRALVPAGPSTQVNTPGTLVRLPDGRLVLVYGYRVAPFGVRTRISSDNGRTWSDEVILRQDGGSFDLGYTRAVLRPDGKVVTAYYFNPNSLQERTIEASIFDPTVAFASPGPTVPGPPTSVVATAGDSQASVTFGPPATDGGTPILDYTATCGTQSATGAGSPLVVTGLTNGQSVDCTVTARNEIGTGPLSSPPVPVTPRPKVVPSSVTVTEGNTGATIAQVPVSLSAPSSQTVTAQWATGNYQASAPGDFVTASGTVSFAPNQTQQTVQVTIKGDLLDEGDEAALVQFSNPTNATIGGFAGLGAVIITDDDPLPQIVPKGASVTEGNSGTKVLQVPVTLSAPSGRTVTASWTTQNDQATAPSDFVAKSGTVTFSPGQTQKTVAVTIKGDTAPEPKERFFVAFSNPTNATVGGIYGLGFATILNDD